MRHDTFFALCFRMKYITRWGLMRNIRPETLTEHSAECAMLAHAIALIGVEKFGKTYSPDRAAVLALYHDLGEVYTGDLPTPVKYFNREMQASYKKIEDDAAQKLLTKLPDELRPHYEPILQAGQSANEKELYRVVKAADKLSALIKCADEVKNGNTEFRAALMSTREAVDQFDCEELHYFCERFLPSFDLSLDDL